MVAITPYGDLSSEDILSAHISALQHNVNKLETILDMVTTAKTAQPLNAVHDQTDSAMQYKIYEGVDRNWLASPTPVIKRNGLVVSPLEYTLKPAQGAVIFATKQLATDAITGDYTMISAGSNALASVNSQLTALAGVSTQFPPTRLAVGPHPIGLYRSHGIAGGLATNVSVAANAIDIFPYFVTKPITYDKMMVIVHTAAASAHVKMAVYADNNYWPGALVAATGDADCSTVGAKELPFLAGDQLLQPGMYWIAKWNDLSTITLDYCVAATSAISLGDSFDNTLVDSNTQLSASIGGIRATVTYASSFPDPFPAQSSTVKYIKRASYASPWIRRKA